MHWILIGYMWLYLYRPFEIWPVLGSMQLERVYMLFALSVWLVARKRWLPNPLHWAFLAFIVAMFFCHLNSPWGDVGSQTVEDYAKIAVFYLLLVTVVHDEQGLKRCLLAYLVIMALYVSHSCWEYLHGRHVFRMGLARLMGVGVSRSDPNSFAATILYSLPMIVPVWWACRSLLVRFFLIGYVPLAIVCLLLTGSRAAFVGLLACGLLLMVFTSQRPWRWAVLVLPLLPLGWVALPEALQVRFTTLVDPSVGPANALQSAQGRMWGFLRGMELWARNPLTGCGPGAFAVAANATNQSHNLYGQIAGEMGTLGVVTFAGLIVCFAVNELRLRRLYRDLSLRPDFPFLVVQAVSVSVLLLLVMGWGGHNLFRFNWLWYGAFQVIAVHCVRANLWTAWQAELEKGFSTDDACNPEQATYPDGPALAGRWDPDPYPV